MEHARRSPATPGSVRDHSLARLLGAGLVVVTLDLALAFAASAAPLFVDAPVFTPGVGPAHLADLNKDGHVDLVVPEYTQIRVYLGAGGGFFSFSANYPAGGSPTPATGDVNGDGNVDIVMAVSLEHGISVLLGNGDGTFHAGQSFPTYNFPHDIRLADLNGDTKLDVVVCNENTYRITVLLGNGDGTFGPRTGFGPAQYDYTLRMEVADLDLDGKLDVVAANRVGNTISTFHGNGDGTFNAPVNFAANGPFGLSLGDLNGDLLPDLAYLDEPFFQISIRLGTPTGFSTSRTLLQGMGQVNGATIVDADGDGLRDVIVAKISGLSFFPGRGDGGFDPRRDDFPTPWWGIPSLVDLDGDPRGDLIASVSLPNGPWGLTGLFGIPGDAGWVFGRSSVPVGTGAMSLLLHDLNADGHLDLVSAHLAASKLSIAPGSGAAGFGSPTDLAMPGARSVAAGDLNGDGIVDLAVANEPGKSLTLLPGVGGGVFGTPTIVSTLRSPHFVLVADVTGDGRDDIVATTSESQGANHVILFVQTDGGLLQACGFWSDREPRGAALADLDADGRVDLVTANRLGNDLSVFPGVADVVFGTRTDVSTAMKPVSVAAGDLNGDRYPDLVAACESGFISVLVGRGDGTFLPRVDLSTIAMANSIALGDLDGDGILDLTTAVGAGMEVRLGNADATFQAPTYHGFAPVPSHHVLADWSGDGTLDAAISSPSAAVWVLENATAGPTANAHLVRPVTHANWVPEVRPTTLPFQVQVTCTVDAELPASWSGLTAWPNPGRGNTTLRFGLSLRGEAQLVVYDVGGRRVRGFPVEEHNAGPNAMFWDGRDDSGQMLASGVYLARLRSAAGTQTTRFVLLR